MEAQCKGSYVLGTACGRCKHCLSEQAKMMAGNLIPFGSPGPEAHEAALAYYKRPLVIHAASITPERCCFITGVIRACLHLKQEHSVTARVLQELGVTNEEVGHECIGHSDGRTK